MDSVHWKRDTAVFLTSQAVSIFGTMLVQYAITWHVTLLTGSGMMMTISILCGFLPMFALSPIAGVWADRYSRKMLIALSDTITACATLLLVILFSLGYRAVWLLFVASAVRSLGAAVQTPAVEAILPQIVPEDRLMKINGLNNSIQSVFSLIAPLLSGVLLSVASIQFIFMLDVITAGIAVSLLSILRIKPTRHMIRETAGYLGDIKAGISYIRRHRFILVIFAFSAYYLIMASPLAFLSPLQVARNYGSDVWRLTAIEVAYSLGMILGGLMIAFWGGFANRAITMGLSACLVAVMTFLLGLPLAFPPYLLIMGLIGLILPIFTTPVTVLLQQKVEDAFLGARVQRVGHDSKPCDAAVHARLRTDRGRDADRMAFVVHWCGAVRTWAFDIAQHIVTGNREHRGS